LWSAIPRPLYEGFFLEIDRRVPLFADWQDADDVAHAVSMELRSLTAAVALLRGGQGVHSRVLIIRGKPRLVHTPREEGIRQALVAIAGSITLPVAATLRRDHITHGYLPGRSAYSNSTQHVGSKWVQQFDIKHFFPSISTADVEAALEQAGMGSGAARLVASLTTLDDHLPLGFMPSPTISNLVATDIDLGLYRLARENRLRVTRYADDITLSADARFDHEEGVSEVLERAGFELNDSKSRSGSPDHGVRVTGYTLSGGLPRLPRHLKRKVRQDLYSIGRIGIERQAEIRGRTARSFVRRLNARLGMIKQCEPQVFEAMQMKFPTAFAALNAVRSTANQRRLEKACAFERQLRVDPVTPPGYYKPSALAGEDA
jgi:hypothetical protein